MRHLIGGMALMALGLWGMAVWWGSFGLVMRGLVPFFLLGFGLIALLSAYNRLLGSADVPTDEFDPDRRS